MIQIIAPNIQNRLRRLCESQEHGVQGMKWGSRKQKEKRQQEYKNISRKFGFTQLSSRDATTYSEHSNPKTDEKLLLSENGSWSLTNSSGKSFSGKDPISLLDFLNRRIEK